jgi:hypothetical protein
MTRYLSESERVLDGLGPEKSRHMKKGGFFVVFKRI